jgi:hypothetical protein
MLRRDPIDPDTLDKARFQIELETFADDPGKKAAHRMRLPAGGFCERGDGRATGGSAAFLLQPIALCRIGPLQRGYPSAPPGLASVGCSMVQPISPHFAFLPSLSSGSPSIQVQPAGCTAEAPQKLLSRRGGARSDKARRKQAQ